MNRRIYLASPYTSPSQFERQIRCEAAAKACAVLSLMGEGYVYAPIPHGCAHERYLPGIVRDDHDYWMRHCFAFLDACDELVVLMIDGWDTSKGVHLEIQRAQERGMRTRYAHVVDDFERLVLVDDPLEVPV